jgi:hypothetical protein
MTKCTIIFCAASNHQIMLSFRDLCVFVDLLIWHDFCDCYFIRDWCCRSLQVSITFGDSFIVSLHAWEVITIIVHRWWSRLHNLESYVLAISFVGRESSSFILWARNLHLNEVDRDSDGEREHYWQVHLTLTQLTAKLVRQPQWKLPWTRTSREEPWSGGANSHRFWVFFFIFIARGYNAHPTLTTHTRLGHLGRYSSARQARERACRAGGARSRPRHAKLLGLDCFHPARVSDENGNTLNTLKLL